MKRGVSTGKVVRLIDIGINHERVGRDNEDHKINRLI